MRRGEMVSRWPHKPEFMVQLNTSLTYGVLAHVSNQLESADTR